MEVNVIVFGQFRDLMGKSFTLKDVPDTDSLVAILNKKYPQFTGLTYLLAVDKETITENTLLTHDCTVALLPPFSGG